MTMTETEFADRVQALKADPTQRDRLLELLREDSPLYNQRSAAATVRMRGWALLAYEESGLTDAALIFVLEELDNGRDPYLVAAAARVLRSYRKPSDRHVAFLLRALSNISFHDDLVSFDHYGAYTTKEGTTATREVLTTLRWLGGNARSALHIIEEIRLNKHGEYPPSVVAEAALTVDAICRAVPPADEVDSPRQQGVAGASMPKHCCGAASPPKDPAQDRELSSRLEAAGEKQGEIVVGARIGVDAGRDRLVPDALGAVVFEDQDGRRVAYDAFLKGSLAIVTFFYTRCTNPQKCSLTITKLARLQRLVEESGISERVRIAAITYDPMYDLAQRLRAYGVGRGMQFNANHRMLRTIHGWDALQEYFQLGVNFVGSLVNRHRVELFILDSTGEIRATFDRIQWNELEVLEWLAMQSQESRP
jgi:protein SCO1/2